MFDTIYGVLIDGTGWTVRAIDELEFDEVAAVFRHWRRDPPWSSVVKHFLGATPEGSRAPSSSPSSPDRVTVPTPEPDASGMYTEDQLRAFVAQLGG